MKIIDCIVLGVACLACTPSDCYTLQGILPENSKATEVYLLSGEGKGADTLAKSMVREDRTFTLKGKAENRLLYLNMGNYGGRVYFYSEPGIVEKLLIKILCSRNGVFTPSKHFASKRETKITLTSACSSIFWSSVEQKPG